MASELEIAEKRVGQNRWMIQLVSGLVVLIICIILMIDIESDNIMNFIILMMLSAAGFLLILSVFGFFRERARKKRLERIRARRLSSA